MSNFTKLSHFISLTTDQKLDREDISIWFKTVKKYAPVKELFDECYFALEDVFKKMSKNI